MSHSCNRTKVLASQLISLRAKSTPICTKKERDREGEGGGINKKESE